jgi:GrpB-like predicted nucleotidyltransferase (UPF0157 family)
MADRQLETGLIGGIEKRNIKIVDYDADWPNKFAKHAKMITDAIGSSLLRIEHIGSTSVPSLAAKPVIDFLVVVPDSANESAYLPQLESAGYVLRVREPDWNEHRMFRTPEKDVHIHVYSAGCPEIQRNLIFRNRLRKNTEDRRRYEQTKRELATKEWPDMNAYAEAKGPVIESIIVAEMASKAQIRQATPEEVDVVADILKEAARWLEQAGMPLWREDDLEPARIIPDVNSGLFFLAEDSGEFAGTVKFQLDDPVFWPDARPQEAAYIHRLAVRRRYAGTGLSTLILRWAVERTRMLGRRYLRLDCAASRPRLSAVYERFGFQYHSDNQVGPFLVSRYEYDVMKL